MSNEPHKVSRLRAFIGAAISVVLTGWGDGRVIEIEVGGKGAPDLESQKTFWSMVATAMLVGAI